MKIYNTLTKSKQKFKPIKNGKVLMYHCGPTVYWTQHIGNMRAMVLADLIVRSFKYLNYKIKLVRNYTDVGHLTSDSDEGEDKIEKASKRENLNPLEIAEKYIKIFEKDIHLLNVPDADVKPRATEMISEIIKMTQTLLDKNFAYTTDLAIYFDVSKFTKYGELSGQKLQDKMQGAGKAEVEDKNKKNPVDFALWFFKAGKHKNALQFWNSPFKSKLVENGKGFPGWHIECSVMANKFLGKTIDIHMGGVEHISIHHTNEIAQSESANGVKFVNHWIHNEHLLVDNKKMSKSEGTAFSVQEIIDKGFNPLALRYFFLNAHYKSKQNFTWEALKASQNGLDKLYNFLACPESRMLGKESKTNLKNTKKEFQKKFVQFISDNFNIPQALALTWEIVKSNKLDYKTKKELILDFDKIFGLNLNKINPKYSGEKIKIPDEIQKLIKQRKKARSSKDYGLADQLRGQIKNLGFVVEDLGDESKISLKK